MTACSACVTQGFVGMVMDGAGVAGGPAGSEFQLRSGGRGVPALRPLAKRPIRDQAKDGLLISPSPTPVPRRDAPRAIRSS